MVTLGCTIIWGYLMEKPKKYIIFANVDYKGWVWLFDSNNKKLVDNYIREYLQDVTWQWVLTKTLKLRGY
jgi:hypothetical protein